MVKISVTIQSNRLGSIAAKLPGQTRALVAKTVLDVEGQAKGNIVSMGAVDTGAMLNNTTGRMVSDTEGEVVSGQDYSIHVHEGTYKMAGRPFLQMAAEQVRPAFEAGAAKLVNL